MTARIRKLLSDLSETFWLVPGLMVVAGVLAAVGLVSLDRSGVVPQSLIDSAWLYNGGGTGARTLLGAVAASTIGVAGTVFSITIAALSLAAGQMGPRLLRNFTRDRGNQITLGVFLGTFSYALMVLRSIRTVSEGEFVPHLSLSVGILLAFVCVATLVFFVGHMAGRINVDTVIDLVSEDVRSAIQRLTTDDAAARATAGRFLAQCGAGSRSPARLPAAARRRGSRRLGGRAQNRYPPAGPARRLRLPGRTDRADDPARGRGRCRDPQRHGPGAATRRARPTSNSRSGSWSR